MRELTAVLEGTGVITLAWAAFCLAVAVIAFVRRRMWF